MTPSKDQTPLIEKIVKVQCLCDGSCTFHVSIHNQQCLGQQQLALKLCMNGSTGEMEVS